MWCCFIDYESSTTAIDAIIFSTRCVIEIVISKVDIVTFSDICFLEGNDGWFTEERSRVSSSLLACRPRTFHCRSLAITLLMCQWPLPPPCAQTAEQQSGLQSLSLLGQPFVREAFEFWGGLNHLQNFA